MNVQFRKVVIFMSRLSDSDHFKKIFTFLAEEQLCQYPGLTRGLVAVLLYYDGRKALVHALRTLIQGRSGVSWTLGASDDITDLISKYTQSLIEDGLVDKILSK